MDMHLRGKVENYVTHVQDITEWYVADLYGECERARREGKA